MILIIMVLLLLVHAYQLYGWRNHAPNLYYFRRYGRFNHLPSNKYTSMAESIGNTDSGSIFNTRTDDITEYPRDSRLYMSSKVVDHAVSLSDWNETVFVPFKGQLHDKSNYMNTKYSYLH